MNKNFTKMLSQLLEKNLPEFEIIPITREKIETLLIKIDALMTQKLWLSAINYNFCTFQHCLTQGWVREDLIINIMDCLDSMGETMLSDEIVKMLKAS